jgi:hypothetical protein
VIDADPDHRWLWEDRAHDEEDDDDGSDCWIRHDGMTASSDKGIRYRIGSQNIWFPKAHIVASTKESIQVTRWLREQRPELFRKKYP